MQVEKMDAEILSPVTGHTYSANGKAVPKSMPTSPPGIKPTTIITDNSYWDTDMHFVTTGANLGGPPSASAPTAAKMQYLHVQLSSIDIETVVLERFTLLGPSQRRQGGAQTPSQAAAPAPLEL